MHFGMIFLFGNQAARAEIITHGSPEHRRVALTFDGDMTESMLERQRRGEVKQWYDARIFE